MVSRYAIYGVRIARITLYIAYFGIFIATIYYMYDKNGLFR